MSKPFSQNGAAGALQDADILSVLQTAATASGVDNFNTTLADLRTFLNQYFLLKGSDLSDLNDAALARGNLGLGDAALKTVGTADTNLPTISDLQGKLSTSGLIGCGMSVSGSIFTLLPPAESFVPTAPTANHVFSFISPEANVGTVTIKLGVGGPTASARTITGEILPAGYIRAGVPTLMWFDGTYYVVDRQPEHGANSGGEFLRLANGIMECWKYIDENATITNWTFPAPFVSGSFPIITGAGRITARIFTVDEAGTLDNTMATVELYRDRYNTSSAAPQARFARAIGRWY